MRQSMAEYILLMRVDVSRLPDSSQPISLESRRVHQDRPMMSDVAPMGDMDMPNPV